MCMAVSVLAYRCKFPAALITAVPQVHADALLCDGLRSRQQTGPQPAA